MAMSQAKLPTAELAAAESATAAGVSPAVLVLMGVSGSGKSTIALELRRVLGWPFLEGDELHPPANVEKMRAGHPLTRLRHRTLADYAQYGWILPGQAVPVRKRLLLVLPEGDKYEYLCPQCGSTCGTTVEAPPPLGRV